ncbi:hypothetical protein Ahy_B10g106430 isoform C [Arachis hypogaea]|uniref:FAR1 domain-containing protein n=1 Tax=Arachis hypogaea TaxID=3818 RepID=A0A444XAT5_ARAHY|nr:hypothetical protein Ahy_B10g106430 isoform C [Arachis hypogaea]
MRHRNVPQSMDLEMEATGFESEEEEEEEDDEDDEEEQHPQTNNNDNNNYNNPSSSNSNPNSTTEPYIGMEFDSELSARAFYNAYARRIGFSTRVSVCLRSRKDSSVIRRRVVCSREGFRRNPENHDPKRHRSVTRVGCKAQITVKKKGPLGKWYISKFIKDHNHDLVPPDRVHCLRSHRRVNGAARSLIDTLHAAGMGAAEVMTVLIKDLSREIMSYVEMGAESSDTYSVALNGLREAAKKVADAKKPRPAPVQSTSDNNENHESSQSSDTDQDKKIQELTTELEGARQRCESYRQNLFGLLKNMEEQKLKISVKAQSVRLNLGSELVAEESKEFLFVRFDFWRRKEKA